MNKCHGPSFSTCYSFTTQPTENSLMLITVLELPHPLKSSSRKERLARRPLSSLCAQQAQLLYFIVPSSKFSSSLFCFLPSHELKHQCRQWISFHFQCLDDKCFDYLKMYHPLILLFSYIIFLERKGCTFLNRFL